MKKEWIGAIVALSMMLGGCGIDRTVVRLTPPDVQAEPDAQKIVIGTIRDRRDFLTTPDSFGERLNKTTRDTLGESGRATVVGGNVRFIFELPHGERVEDVVAELLRSGLQGAGYRVVKAEEADAGTAVASADIDEFWCYMPTNTVRMLTWTTQFRAWIDTTVTVKSAQGEKRFVVSARGGNIAQVFSVENIEQTYEPTFDDYLKQFHRKAAMAR